MKTLYHLVSTLNASDARSAMYYLSRYLKQAAKFEKYGKDIFEDDKRSAPSDSIRNLTLAMIQFIENDEGVSAAEFNDQIYSRWASHIADVESGLQPEASPFELERATEFINSISVPSNKRL